MTNYHRTASWLKACGKAPSASDLSVQIGCHIEEFREFIEQIDVTDPVAESYLLVVTDILEKMAKQIKSRTVLATIPPQCRPGALDALCDMEVTGNGVAYLAGFNKPAADAAVLDANDRKLVDGKPVLLEGGKIGKPEGWKAPDLANYAWEGLGHD